MLFQNTISTYPFTQWLWRDKENKKLLLFSTILIVVSFAFIKVLYPYPNFATPDTYSYLKAAQQKDFISIWPIGYSWFLRLVKSINSSHIFLVVLQYLLLQTSVLYFLFTIRYLLSPPAWSFRLLLIATIACPLLPHIANLVLSDSLFTTLSLIWFTQLIWIIFKPNLKLLLIHAFIILLAFTVRFNASYYPFISITLILISRIDKTIKWLGVSSILILLLLYIGCTQHEYFKRTGTIQYSAFAGWLIAANALYSYSHIKHLDTSGIPHKFKKLHSVVNNHMRLLAQTPTSSRPDRKIGVYYFWDYQSPLRAYMRNQGQNKITKSSYFKYWSDVGPLYAAYGRFIIKKHPGSFMRYYVWPNLVLYYSPPTGLMSTYNRRRDTVDPLAVNWFELSHNKVPTLFKDKNIQITKIFQIGFAIINTVFIFNLIFFSTLTGFKKCSSNEKILFRWFIIFWVCNVAFSIVAAPIELRYQLFPALVTFCFMWLLMSFIIEQALMIQTNHTIYNNHNSDFFKSLSQH